MKLGRSSGGRGRGRWGVAEPNTSGGETVLVEKLQVETESGGEEGGAPADRGRADDGLVLVHEAGADGLRREVGAVHRGVAVGDGLKCADGFGGEGPLDAGSLARNILQRRGVDDLVDGLPLAGVLDNERRMGGIEVGISQKSIVSYIRRP